LKLSARPRVAFFILATALSAAGCASSSKAPTPGKQGAAASPQPSAGPEGNPEPESTPSPITIELANPSASLTYPVGQPVRLEFTLGNLNGRRFTAGLVKTPPGATLTLSTSSVAMDWTTPTAGTYDVVVLVRDLEACEAAEANPNDCTIATSEFGSLTAKSYDVESQSYALVIGTDPSNTVDPNGTGDAGLIQQIIALLGGGGGTGTGGGIQGLLQGLSNGQLSQILSSLQGGSGLDITQLIQMVLGG
jgi:hypothetical protein